MAGIALKSCKLTMKQDNGLTATGRQSTKTTNFKGGQQTATANTVVGFLSAVASCSDGEVISYGRVDENLVSDEL